MWTAVSLVEKLLVVAQIKKGLRHGYKSHLFLSKQKSRIAETIRDLRMDDILRLRTPSSTEVIHTVRSSPNKDDLRMKDILPVFLGKEVAFFNLIICSF